MFVLEFVVRKRQQKILEQLLKIDFFSYLGILALEMSQMTVVISLRRHYPEQVNGYNLSAP
jgi:uncharacterized protein with von Willebrand factor type A (vWA) domain